MCAANQQLRDNASAGDITRHQFLYPRCLDLGLALDHLLPLRLSMPGAAAMQWIVAGGLILIGLAIMAAGVRGLSNAATPVPSNQPVRTLVTAGIHGWSRNPIYVG